MKYSSFGQWISRAWLAFMDESQQHAALAALQQAIGDHRQTPGGLSKGRAAAENRRKLLQRPLGLRALDKTGDYLPPARMAALIAQLWPDASQDPDSDLYSLLRLGKKSHVTHDKIMHCPSHCNGSSPTIFSTNWMRVVA